MGVLRVVDHRVTYIGFVALVLGVATGLRLFNIDQFGFNSDEAVYAGQAAALAGHHDYQQLFGVFRAHPLLVHFLVSLVYRVTGVNDLAPRLVNVAFGVGMVAAAGALATVTRNRLAGLLTMLFLAISAYPVTVSRQMLLDGPEAFFFTVTLLLLALYVRRPRGLTLYAAACCAGLAFLAKETAILFVPAVLAFILVARDVPVKLRDFLVAVGVYVLTIAPFPIALMLSGGGTLAQEFFVWQVFRRPNHDLAFYLSVIPSMGTPIVLLAAVGFAAALKRRNGFDVLLTSLTVVVIAFFEAWPVKGFQYLIPLATPVALFAADGVVVLSALLARALERMLSAPRVAVSTAAKLVLVAASAAALALGSGAVVMLPAPTVLATDSGDDGPVPAGYSFTAGTGGLEASRPVGNWARNNTLPGSHFLTVGPSLANVIQFYGGREALALSVSPNPLHRNPTYQPVLNPDLMVKTNSVQYLVYDSYSAARTPFFGQKILTLVHKYNGVLVYSDYEPVRHPDNTVAQVPIVLVYEVHP